MILEHAILPVQVGRGEDFERAFTAATHIISSMPGFIGLTLSRCVERPDAYLLLVQWRTLADHVEGFRKSEPYQEWRNLLHHLYDPFPVVEHFEQVHSA